MITRRIISLLAVALLCGVSAVRAQESPTLESLDQRANSLETRLTTIETSLANISDQLNKLLNTPAVDTPPLADDLSLEQRVQLLEEGYSELKTIVGQVAKPGQDGYTPNILGKMTENGEFSGEVAKAVQGKLRFRNYTGTEQVLYINGSPWRVLPGESYIWVPYGVVTTAQSLGEQPTEADQWTFNGSNPEMMVKIGG